MRLSREAANAEVVQVRVKIIKQYYSTFIALRRCLKKWGGGGHYKPKVECSTKALFEEIGL